MDEKQILEELKRLIDTSASLLDFYAGLNRLFRLIPGIRYAWIGLLDNASKTVIPVIESGLDVNYLGDSKFRVDDSVYSKGPTGRAFSTRKPSYQDDIANSPNYLPWHDQAIASGFASSASIPIIIKGSVVGTLNLYSGNKARFDNSWKNCFDEAIKLMSEGLWKIPC